MSPDQDNDILTMACEELNLNKLRKYSRRADEIIVGAGLCTTFDLSEIEHRIITMAGFDSIDEVIGSSPYSVRMLMPKFPDPEVMAAPLKKEPKHWEKFNKKRKGGRW